MKMEDNQKPKITMQPKTIKSKTMVVAPLRVTYYPTFVNNIFMEVIDGNKSEIKLYGTADVFSNKLRIVNSGKVCYFI